MYTKKEILKAAEIGEISMIDAKHIVSLLDEAKELIESKEQKSNDSNRMLAVVLILLLWIAVLAVGVILAWLFNG